MRERTHVCLSVCKVERQRHRERVRGRQGTEMECQETVPGNKSRLQKGLHILLSWVKLFLPFLDNNSFQVKIVWLLCCIHYLHWAFYIPCCGSISGVVNNSSISAYISCVLASLSRGVWNQLTWLQLFTPIFCPFSASMRIICFASTIGKAQVWQGQRRRPSLPEWLHHSGVVHLVLQMEVLQSDRWQGKDWRLHQGKAVPSFRLMF